MILPRVPQTAAAVADHYDELDPVYRELWGQDVHHGLWRTGRETPAEATAALSALVAERLGLKPGNRLIDIGCGYGATARRFATLGAQVIGYTLSAEQVAHALPAAGVTLRCQDFLANELATAGADGAYSIESSEHFVDKPRLFQEARRVLRPGGRFVVCAWLSRPEPSSWQVRHLLEPICYEGRLPSMGTADEYRGMAELAGFRQIAYEDVSAQVERTWTICLNRFLRAMLTDRAMRRRVFAARNRLFALSVPRLILAYRTGAMRYGIFAFEAV